MTCPPHKWKLTDYRFDIRAYCEECEVEIMEEEIERRLNATEALSAEQANSIAANLVPEVFKPNSVELAQKEMLNRYTKILGGEECTTNS